MQRAWEFNNKKDMLSYLIGKDFGDDPENKIEEIRAHKHELAAQISKTLSLNPKDQVLEIGSGIGFMSSFVAPRVEHLHCCDISESFLDSARQECAPFSNVSFHHISPAQFPFLKDGSIDKAFANNVFIHFNLFDIYLYLEELARVLKPGGQIWLDIASTENLRPSNLPPLFLEMLELYRQSPQGIGNLVQWNSTETVGRLSKHFGFSVKQETPTVLHLTKKT